MKELTKVNPLTYICASLLSFSLAGCGSSGSDSDFYAVNLLQSVSSACIDNLGSERGDAVGLNLIRYYGTKQAGANLSFQGNGSCAEYAAANNTSWGVILTAEQYRQTIRR